MIPTYVCRSFLSSFFPFSPKNGGICPHKHTNTQIALITPLINMALPPVPESPSRQLPRKFQGTPRVGMRISTATEDDADDVSVLTFNTLNARDNTSSYVRAARESLEKLILESKNSGDDDCNIILSRISEEGASQNTPSNSKTGCDRSNSTKSSLKCEEKEETEDTMDDDTITVAESILDSANKVLSNFGSSPYYSGRRKNESPETHESPAPQPHPKHPSPMKRPTKMSDAEEDEKGHGSRNMFKTEKEDSASKESISEKDKQLEVSSSFLNSYFCDENIKPCDNNTNKRIYAITANTTKVGNAENEDHLQKLESETRRLQSLLKERQLETSRANQALLSSIKKAHELLDSISVDRE